MLTQRPAEPTVSVIVPAKNEAENLREVLPTLGPVHEVVLVVSPSDHESVEAAREVMPDIRVVHQTRKGKGNALVCGFLAATGDVIVMFDADGSADAAEIPRFVEALRNGADFAKGSRFVAGGGSEDITGFRSLGNAGLNLIANVLFGTRNTDLCYGYNAFWRDMLPHLGLPNPQHGKATADQMLWGDGFEIETVLNCRMARCGARTVEVPSVELLRLHGESNLNAISDGFRVLRTMLSERFGLRAPHALPPALEVAADGSFSTHIPAAAQLSAVRDSSPAIAA